MKEGGSQETCTHEETDLTNGSVDGGNSGRGRK